MESCEKLQNRIFPFNNSILEFCETRYKFCETARVSAWVIRKKYDDKTSSTVDDASWDPSTCKRKINHDIIDKSRTPFFINVSCKRYQVDTELHIYELEYKWHDRKSWIAW